MTAHLQNISFVLYWGQSQGVGVEGICHEQLTVFFSFSDLTRLDKQTSYLQMIKSIQLVQQPIGLTLNMMQIAKKLTLQFSTSLTTPYSLNISALYMLWAKTYLGEKMDLLRQQWDVKWVLKCCLQIKRIDLLSKNQIFPAFEDGHNCFFPEYLHFKIKNVLIFKLTQFAFFWGGGGG